MSLPSASFLRGVIEIVQINRERCGITWPEGAAERIFNACAGERPGEPMVDAMERAMAAEERVPS